ncbi:MAG: hypothetical protein K5929_10945 [Lachnospiraceae bacterium]|nr:hypothetical protein [Lachnospiraceae bacterium]
MSHHIIAKGKSYIPMVGDSRANNKDNVPTEHIDFKKPTDWKKYVDSRRLEITCGEAPYLVSRYDVETGEYIPIPKRIGILDRKLRVVNENAVDEKEWLKWLYGHIRHHTIL